MVVQHNLKAMNSNRMLSLTQSTQAKSTEKLSSGYKINRAADDAAGLSISEKMRKQIRGLTQASTNAQDGISAVQTAEGALNEVQDMLQRMNELAVKAANGTNSEDDRNYIQDEIDQLVTEIDRVAETTKFNETYLLKGDRDADPKTKYAYSTDPIDTLNRDLYYISNNSVQTLTSGTHISDISTANMSYYSDKPVATVGEALTTANSATYITSANVIKDDQTYYKKVGNDYIQVDAGSKADQATYYVGTYSSDAQIQSLTSVASSDATSSANVVADGKDLFDNMNVHYTAGQSVDGTAYSDYMINSGNVSFMTDTAGVNLADYTDSVPPAQLMDKDGNEIAANGLYRFFDEEGNYKGGLYKSTDKNSEIPVGDTKSINDYISSADKYNTGALTLKLHVGADATDNNQISVELDAMSAESLGVDGLKVSGSTDENARNAIETIKESLQRVSTQRSALGAVQNRLEHTIANLDNVVENTTSAESGIRDTDMASEMVKFSNNNILAQAGQAMLAQANQSNQGVLSLLG